METLQTFGEIGIAIVGFSAFISAFQKKDKNGHINTLRLLIMVETAGLLTIFSVLPLVLINFFSEDTSFQISLTMYAILAPTLTALIRIRNKRNIGNSNLKLTPTSAVLQFTSLTLMILSGVGAFGLFKNLKGTYIGIMMGVLVIALVLFIRGIYFGLLDTKESS